jgi:hypothetical protein
LTASDITPNESAICFHPRDVNWCVQGNALIEVVLRSAQAPICPGTGLHSEIGVSEGKRGQILVRPRRSKRVTIGASLPDEETASRIGLQILRVHRHVADEEDGPAGGIECEGHQRAEGKTRMFAGKRGQRTGRRE